MCSFFAFLLRFFSSLALLVLLRELAIDCCTCPDLAFCFCECQFHFRSVMNRVLALFPEKVDTFCMQLSPEILFIDVLLAVINRPIAKKHVSH